MLSFLVKPFATNLALYLSNVLSNLNLFFKLHLQPINFLSFGKLTISHTLFLFINFNSSFITYFHLIEFGRTWLEKELTNHLILHH